MIRVSLVILTFNQRALTLACLSSLEDFIWREDCETILVDNGSDDGTCEAVKEAFPAVRVLRQERNLGVAAGRNVGLRQACGRYLMILDNDTEADCATILGLAAVLDSDAGIGLVAPRLVSGRGDVQSSFRPYPGIMSKIWNVVRGKRRSSVASKIPKEAMEPFYVIGAAQMFAADVYRAIGGLDENIFYGPEDADFCMAVRALGLRVVYEPSYSIVHHYQRVTSGRLLSQGARRHIKALLYFYRKHRRWL